MARRGRKRNLERERLYWDLAAWGLGTVQAGRQVGIGRRTGLRWRRENGGFRRDLGGGAPVVGRHLSLFERERVQSVIGQGVGVREIGRRLGRSPSTISRELHRAGDRERAAARARSIAGRTFSTSPARRAIVREAVGSEATCPKTVGSARTTGRSEQVSPPRANVNARSSSTLAGSCTANGLRHRASSPDSATSNPAARTVEVSSTPPACATADLPFASTLGRG